jgi:predicted NBD/HSP70 family sugar kinase
MANGDERAAKIYSTIGTYLGYSIAHYADFYEIREMLLLGRVTSGEGGSIIIEKANEVLAAEFPALKNQIETIHNENKEQTTHHHLTEINQHKMRFKDLSNLLQNYFPI